MKSRNASLIGKLKIVGLTALLLFTPLSGAAAAEHFFPLIVNGEGFRNRIFVTNASESSNPCTFSLHGGARSMQTSLADGAFSPEGEDTMFELLDGAGTILTLASIDGNAQTFGYAKLECASPVAAWLLLSLESGGTVLSLAALEGANPGAAFQFPVLSRLGRLAMAFSNEADLDTVCSAEVEDGMGAILGGGSFTIPAASSTLRFLDELIPAPDGVSAGKVRVSCARDVAAVGLPLEGAAFTMLSATMLDRHETARSTHILPLIADGGGFRSQILLTNLSDSSNRCVLDLRGGAGDADRFQIPSAAAVTGSSIAVELAAESDQASISSTGGEQQSLAAGYAAVECESPVAARNMLTLNEGGHLTGMAAVPETQPADGMEFPVAPALGRLMPAITNDAVWATSCAVELRANGATVSIAEPFAVASQSTSLRFLDELLAVPDDFPGGTTRLTCFSEIAATSLLVGGRGFATMRQAISPVRPNSESLRTIPDHNLLLSIARELDMAPEAEIRASDLARLRELNARNAGIGSLKGLEHATELTRLDLGPAPWDPALGYVNSNRVADLAPILGLSNLEHLDLSHNDWAGPIPPGIGQLGNLSTLNLEFNRLEGNIPDELGHLRNLTSLRLRGNRLTGSIPPELGRLAGLVELNLALNSLSGPIPAELGSLSNLEDLRLAGNRLSGEVPRQLGNLTNLTHLRLTRNLLTGSIPRELGDLPNLTFLNLRANALSGSIPRELGNLAGLTMLSLAGNRLTGSIPNELGDLRNLTWLYLDENALSGTIPPELGNLRELTVLSLADNQLSGGIPSELRQLAELTELWLDHNELSGSIPAALGLLPNLESLRLGNNRLSGMIPGELGRLAGLQDLWLGHNELSGPVPAELALLPDLESLRLGNNRLGGTIPRELGHLASLKELWLDDNELSGPVPAELGLLPSLESLKLSNNRLAGEIPEEVGDLADRIEVWLRGNLLAGWIPDGPLPVRVGLFEPAPTADESITVTLAEALNGSWFHRPIEVGAYPVAPGGDGPGVFVAELEGRIMLLGPEDGESVVLLDIGERVTTLGSQQGLLGVTLDPLYEESGHLWVSYWPLGGPMSFRVSRFTADLPSLQRVDPESELVIMEIEQPSRYHAGGALRFGPDGMLYLALGDGQPGNDRRGDGQNLETLQGSIVRINVATASATSPYVVPSDNPFTSIPDARPEIWAYGLRHPWRMAFDPATGELWAGDVGQHRWEEINHIEAGGNYGWNHLEGRQCFNPPQGCGRTGTVPPIVEYGHHLGCAVTGGVVYRGSAIPALVGHYLFSDSCSGRLWALRPDGGDVIEIGMSPRPILSFGTDADGEVYLSTLQGSVLRIEPPAQ